MDRMASSFSSVVAAETLKACELIGVHLLAAGGEAGSSGSQPPIWETCGGTVVL